MKIGPFLLQQITARLSSALFPRRLDSSLTRATKDKKEKKNSTAHIAEDKANSVQALTCTQEQKWKCKSSSCQHYICNAKIMVMWPIPFFLRTKMPSSVATLWCTDKGGFRHFLIPLSLMHKTTSIDRCSYDFWILVEVHLYDPWGHPSADENTLGGTPHFHLFTHLCYPSWIHKILKKAKKKTYKKPPSLSPSLLSVVHSMTSHPREFIKDKLVQILNFKGSCVMPQIYALVSEF